MLYLMLFSLTVSFATPPTSIDLKYDMTNASLHVEAVHPSFNLEKSYVRLMNVYVNGTQVSTKDYFKQDDYNEFTDDVPVNAQVGDVIKVELFCSLGGDMSKELTVSKAEGTNNGQEQVGSTTDNSLTVNSTNSMNS